MAEVRQGNKVNTGYHLRDVTNWSKVGQVLLYEPQTTKLDALFESSGLLKDVQGGTKAMVKPETCNSGASVYSHNVLSSIEKVNKMFKPLFKKIDKIEAAVTSHNWARSTEPPTSDVLAVTRTFLDRLRANAFRPSGITPSAEGGLGIYFEQNGKYADIEILNTGKLLAVRSNLAGQIVAWEVHNSFEGFNEAIHQIRAFIVS